MSDMETSELGQCLAQNNQDLCYVWYRTIETCAVWCRTIQTCAMSGTEQFNPNYPRTASDNSRDEAFVSSAKYPAFAPQKFPQAGCHNHHQFFLLLQAVIEKHSTIELEPSSH
ncbi:hypothetical protein CEXT_360841 [Caerostris extrusa]|uniref:Uncharacterized protein n=1 Tax=Caerostris extrusa TaxID=172846 RepID=A0AAV4T7B5_CAEEX|nr:hypothetical protein CEXT_360841 [Caerostris extrusa]